MSRPGSPPTQPADGSPLGARRRWLPVVLSGFGVLLAVAMIMTALYGVSVDRAVNHNLQRADALPEAATAGAPGAMPRPTKGARAGDSINFVLIGSDSRAPGAAQGGRSDVLMVIHLSGDRRQAYLVSFPRDMYVPIPGYGRNKINAAFAFGGPKLTVRTLEGLLDTRMDHVVVVDFDGFIAVTEELGGVTVYNRYRSVSGGYTFETGWITLVGPQALAYVRERKQLPRGDLDRAERQRAVVQAILAKGLRKDTLANPPRFLAFARGVARHVTVDDQLTAAEIRKTALSLRLTAEDVVSLQAPISGLGTSPDGQSIDVVDQAKLEELARALRTDTMADYLKRYPPS